MREDCPRHEEGEETFKIHLIEIRLDSQAVIRSDMDGTFLSLSH